MKNNVGSVVWCPKCQKRLLILFVNLILSVHYVASDETLAHIAHILYTTSIRVVTETLLIRYTTRIRADSENGKPPPGHQTVGASWNPGTRPEAGAGALPLDNAAVGEQRDA